MSQFDEGGEIVGEEFAQLFIRTKYRITLTNSHVVTSQMTMIHSPETRLGQLWLSFQSCELRGFDIPDGKLVTLRMFIWGGTVLVTLRGYEGRADVVWVD